MVDIRHIVYLFLGPTSNGAGPSVSNECYEPDAEENEENIENSVQIQFRNADGTARRIEDTRLDHSWYSNFNLDF